MKARDISVFLDSITPLTFPEDGFRYGDPEQEVTGVLTCWMPNVRALQYAIDEGCNVVVFHEFAFYLPRRTHDYEPSLNWPCNRGRRALVDGHHLALIQCHRSMDTFCIAKVIQQRLALPPLSVVEDMAGYDAIRVFDLPPAPVGSYIEAWKRAYGLDRIRVYAPDLAKPVRRAGLAWGGIGLYSNFDLVRRLGELGCDVLIGGETEEYTLEFCADHDIAFVELGHAATEAPGMTVGGQAIAAAFPGLKVATFEEWPLARIV